jgi:hypothetical protein
VAMIPAVHTADSGPVSLLVLDAVRLRHRDK